MTTFNKNTHFACDTIVPQETVNEGNFSMECVIIRHIREIQNKRMMKMSNQTTSLNTSITVIVNKIILV